MASHTGLEKSKVILPKREPSLGIPARIAGRKAQVQFHDEVRSFLRNETPKTI